MTCTLCQLSRPKLGEIPGVWVAAAAAAATSFFLWQAGRHHHKCYVELSVAAYPWCQAKLLLQLHWWHQRRARREAGWGEPQEVREGLEPTSPLPLHLFLGLHSETPEQSLSPTPSGQNHGGEGEAKPRQGLVGALRASGQGTPECCLTCQWVDAAPLWVGVPGH